MTNVVNLVLFFSPSSKVSSQTDFFGVLLTVRVYLQGLWARCRGNAGSFRGRVQEKENTHMQAHRGTEKCFKCKTWTRDGWKRHGQRRRATRAWEWNKMLRAPRKGMEKGGLLMKLA